MISNFDKSDKFDKISFEEPVIVIERDEEEVPVQKLIPEEKPKVSRQWKPWLRWLLGVLTVFLLLLATFAIYKWWAYYYRLGVEVSVTPAQNIEKLKAPVRAVTPEVVLSSDSVLGVPMDFYAIHGLQASLEFEEPDTADTSVFLYCRSADHRVDETYLGSLVVQGKVLESDPSRLGYMAMVDGRMVIGISRSDAVMDYVAERGGSFFRQFILVSNGEIPTRFFLRGKVERRAIGRKGNTLYYIATRHKETMYDFADALCEYGFIDVIYITGGTDYCFYRSSDGERHDIGDINDYPHKKWAGVIPWLVFRKAE